MRDFGLVKEFERVSYGDDTLSSVKDIKNLAESIGKN